MDGPPQLTSRLGRLVATLFQSYNFPGAFLGLTRLNVLFWHDMIRFTGA